MPTRSHTDAHALRLHPVAAISSEDVQLADERMQSAITVLRALTLRDREILIRVYLDRQSAERVCGEMGLTEVQFRLIMSRAKAKLAKLGGKAPVRKRQPVKSDARPAAVDFAVIDIGRVVGTVAHAVAVFGDERKASHWLGTPLPLLGNRSPAQILAFGDDAGAIDQILTRIEYNIPS